MSPGRAEPAGQRPLTPEEEGELYEASLDMNYGDEPLYYSDPTEWPWHTTQPTTRAIVARMRGAKP